jgi:predicted nucleic acid-binding protein
VCWRSHGRRDVPPLPAPVSRDPDDDQVLACALAAKAALIASGDRDLLDLGSFNTIPILRAAQALDHIGAATRSIP